MPRDVATAAPRTPGVPTVLVGPGYEVLIWESERMVHTTQLANRRSIIPVLAIKSLVIFLPLRSADSYGLPLSWAQAESSKLLIARVALHFGPLESWLGSSEGASSDSC